MRLKTLPERKLQALVVLLLVASLMATLAVLPQAATLLHAATLPQGQSQGTPIRHDRGERGRGERRGDRRA